MTAPALAPDVYVPVHLDWAAVVPGDVILGTDDQLLVVAAFHDQTVRLHGHDQWFPIDPAATVRVLVPAPERDALTTTRDVLAARVIERRSA